MKIVFFIFTCLIVLSLIKTPLCQDNQSESNNVPVSNSSSEGSAKDKSITLKNKADKKLAIKLDMELSNVNVITPFNELRTNMFYKERATKKTEYSFNLISTVNNNVKFGGFYGRYINILYNPEMYIEPLERVRVYALHQNSMLIPFDKIRENIGAVTIETAAMVGVESAVNFLFHDNPVLKGIFNFSLKHAALYLVNNFSRKFSDDRIEGYDFYYCSVGITF